jgi:hypothetical protein
MSGTDHELRKSAIVLWGCEKMEVEGAGSGSYAVGLEWRRPKCVYKLANFHSPWWRQYLAIIVPVAPKFMETIESSVSRRSSLEGWGLQMKPRKESSSFATGCIGESYKIATHSIYALGFLTVAILSLHDSIHFPCGISLPTLSRSTPYVRRSLRVLRAT